MTPSLPSPRSSPSLLTTVGWSYFPLAFIGRLPFAMTVVGVLTLVATVRGSYAEAGLTSAFVGIGGAVFGPVLGAFADRWGQRPVLLVAAGLNAAALVLLTALVYADVPVTAVLFAALLVGASSPQLSPMSRSRLVAILVRTLPAERHPKAISGTMSYESMADELVFVFGPVLVGLLAFALAPWAPLVVAAALTVLFVGGFALHPTARAAERGAGSTRAPAPVGALLNPSVLVLVAGTFAVGVFFGAALTSLTAFMGVYAEVSQAGIVYGAMGIGSAAFALGVVLLPQRFGLGARWLTFAVVALAASLLLPTIDSVPVMALALLATGLGIGPVLVTLFSLASVRSPAGRSTTVLTMVGGGVILGQSLSSALTGAVAESAGHSASFLIVVGATAVLVLLAGVNGAMEWRARSRLDG